MGDGDGRMSEPMILSPSDFVEMTNQVLAQAWPSALVKGEVSGLKVNQGKWVFFDLKDDLTSVSCFVPLWELRVPIKDGMQVVARVTPKITQWGRFSLTVRAVRPLGEGSLKKAFEMLKKKLAAEGLFDPARKRPIPKNLAHIGVISSTGAAGYADFVKILNARWGGMKVSVAHTQVQGLDAPDQMIRALRYFNERGEVQAIVVVRGGGSADDLSAFNDEKLARAIAASKIPVMTGIGHEVDTSLADMVADVRASTPSNAAELLTSDRKTETASVQNKMEKVGQVLTRRVALARQENRDNVARAAQKVVANAIMPMREHMAERINMVSVMMRRELGQLYQQLQSQVEKASEMLKRQLKEQETTIRGRVSDAGQKIRDLIKDDLRTIQHKMELLSVMNPEKVLKQGYAILSGKISPGNVVKITTFNYDVDAEVKKVKERN